MNQVNRINVQKSRLNKRLGWTSWEILSSQLNGFGCAQILPLLTFRVDIQNSRLSGRLRI